MNYKELQEKIISTAKKYVGIKEIKGNLGWTSKEFQAKMEKTGWQKSQAWCAYFAELVWSEVYDNVGLFKDMDRYFSGSARRTLSKFAKTEGWETGTVPVPGAIVIWKKVKNNKDQWQGHAGVVVEVRDNYMFTVEGNTNSTGSREGDQVASKTRKYKFEVMNGLALEGFVYPKGIKPPVPFKNKKEGNKFRNWVNDKYPLYARQIQLDRSGSFFNSYITKAYNKFKNIYEL